MASKNFTEMPTTCPDCGGGVWDETKGRGKRSEKAPDCRCKDKDGCGWAGWYAKGAKPAPGGKARVQEYAWGPLLKLCVQYTQKELTPLFHGKCTPEMEKEMAVSLFITGSKEGGHMFRMPAPPVQAPEPVAPSPPPAPPARPAQRGTGMDQGQYQPQGGYDDGSLPF